MEHRAFRSTNCISYLLGVNMIIECVLYSESLDNLVVVRQRGISEYSTGTLELISEFGTDPLTRESLRDLEKNLKLRFIALESVCV